MDNVTRREAVVAAVATTGLVLVGVQPSAAEQKDKKVPGSEFIIKLHGIKLPKEEEARIAKALEATFMRELGKVDLKKQAPNGLELKIPIDWIGLLLRDKGLAQEKIPHLGVHEISK